VPVLGCSGLLPSALLFRQAGAAARGLYVGLETLPAARLDAPGHRFLHDFASTQAGRPISDAAIYAAEATELLVAAIARSDGTRASVAREVRKARVRNGLIGSFRIAATGEAVPARTAIVQLVTPGRSNAIQSYDGARIVNVLTPPQGLLAGAGG
jgi:ABC-type branched-subunit amino acid transport system substrate-binding protein